MECFGDREQGDGGFDHSHSDVLRGVDTQIIPGKAGEQQGDQADDGDPGQAFPGADSKSSVDGAGCRSVAAREGVAGGCPDGISGGDDSCVTDPWTVDAGSQLYNGVYAAAQVIGREGIEAALFVDHPVDKCRDQDQMRYREQGDPLHKGSQKIVGAVSEVLKE